MATICPIVPFSSLYWEAMLSSSPLFFTYMIRRLMCTTRTIINSPCRDRYYSNDFCYSSCICFPCLFTYLWWAFLWRNTLWVIWATWSWLCVHLITTGYLRTTATDIIFMYKETLFWSSKWAMINKFQ